MHYNDIPCLVDYETREDLIDLGVKHLQNGDIAVELGSYLGGSICRLAYQLKALNKSVSVYAIDNWICDNISQDSLVWSNLEKKDEVYDTFIDNIFELDLNNYIRVIKEDTTKAASRFEDNSVNYLFMDAAHGYGGLRDELLVWMPKMHKERCLMFVHDWPCNDIYRAVIDTIGMPQYVARGKSSAVIIDTIGKNDS